MPQVMWTVAVCASFLVWLILGLVVLPAVDASPAFQQLFAAGYAVLFGWMMAGIAYDARLSRRRRSGEGGDEVPEPGAVS